MAQRIASDRSERMTQTEFTNLLESLIEYLECKRAESDEDE